MFQLTDFLMILGENVNNFQHNIWKRWHFVEKINQQDPDGPTCLSFVKCFLAVSSTLRTAGIFLGDVSFPLDYAYFKV